MTESRRPLRGHVAAYGKRSCGCCEIAPHDGGTRAKDKRHDRKEADEQLRDCSEHKKDGNDGT